MRNVILSSILALSIAGGVGYGLSQVTHAAPAHNRYTLLQGSYANPTEYQILVDSLTHTPADCTAQIAVDAGELFVLVGCDK